MDNIDFFSNVGEGDYQERQNEAQVTVKELLQFIRENEIGEDTRIFVGKDVACRLHVVLAATARDNEGNEEDFLILMNHVEMEETDEEDE